MQKKILTEQSLYFGDVTMPKNWDIDRNKLTQDIIESNNLKKELLLYLFF